MLLLDTDTMIDVLRGHRPAIEWLNAVREESIILPGFVVMELLQGCRDRVEQDRAERTVSPFARVWPSPGACDAAVATFAQFRLSDRMGLLDALIAHVAMEQNLPLHTFHQKHYALSRG